MDLTIFQQFYAGKRIFLTGHTGFKGSWLLSWLHRLGCTVKGYSLAPENNNSLYRVLNCDSLCESVIADIRDQERVKTEILSFQPDIVFHLAAQPLVISSYQDPVYTYDVNVKGTANVLDALRFLESPCIAVIITTDKVYSNDESGALYKETDRLGGYDPYSASKAAAEIVIDSYRQSFFHPTKYDVHCKSISVARSGNVIGGGDWSDNRIVPDLVRAIISNEELVVRNHLSVRPWQHVLEPLSGYILLAFLQANDFAKYGEAFNFGPNPEEAVTVEKLIQSSIQVWGKGNYRVVTGNDSMHEAGLLRLDISKAAKILNWHPIYDAKKAIEETIIWYQHFHHHPETILSFTSTQIEEYEQAMFK